MALKSRIAGSSRKLSIFISMIVLIARWTLCQFCYYYFITNFLTNVSACTMDPSPKLAAANILLTSCPKLKGISMLNANTHNRWKPSRSGTSRHFRGLARGTLFLTPKRQAVGSNPAGITQKPVLTADLLGERAFLLFLAVFANEIVTGVGNLLTILLRF